MRVYFVHSENHEDVLREEGCKVLVNYTYMRDKYKSRLKPTLPSGFKDLIIDSGAFQVIRGTKAAYREGYATWLKLLLPNYPEVHGYFNLDVIDDPVATMENQVFMEAQGLNPIPVYHVPEDMKYLDYYTRNYKWVAIGGVASKEMKHKMFYSKFINWLAKKYPDNDFHILGVGISGVLGFFQVDVYSIDFSTWSTISRFGHGIIRDDKQLIKEIKLPDDVRMEIRTNKKLEKDLTREGVKNILYFEETLNNMERKESQLILF